MVRTLMIAMLVCAGATAKPAFAQHPDLGDEKPTNDVCLMCHEDIQKALGARPHKAIEAGCVACHNVAASPKTPFLAADVNTVCLSCHQPPGLPVGVTPRGPVELYKGFSVPGPVIASAPRLNLDKAGRGHPVSNHPVSGPEDPLKKGRRFTCVSCHSPHGSESAKLLAFALKPGEGLCQKCHQM